MSKIKLSENLFLDVAELNRLVEFTDKDGYKRLLKNVVKNYGIVDDGFSVSKKTNSNNVVVISSGIAFNNDLEAILLQENAELQVSNNNVNRWIIISRDVTNAEIGTVSINVDGTMTGISTEFTKVLRGQPNFPVKVKFDSLYNQSEYEVVKVTSDNSAVLSGSFASESGLKYGVVGTFTPGFQPQDNDKMIYEYDSCNIEIIDSEDIPVLSDGQYFLAKVSYDNSGNMVLEDYRVRNVFNVEYDYNSSEESIVKNPLISLISVKMLGSNDSGLRVEMIIEIGYKVNNYEVKYSSPSDSFIISNGECNFYGSGDIPDGLFDKWILLNKVNMKSIVIDSSVNKTLYISKFDSTILEENNEFVIIPRCSNVEVQTFVSNNVNNPEIPFLSILSSDGSIRNRIVFDIYYSDMHNGFSEEIDVKLKSRLIHADKRNKFEDFCIARFDNESGQSEILSESTFSLKVERPEVEQRNYS